MDLNLNYNFLNSISDDTTMNTKDDLQRLHDAAPASKWMERLEPLLNLLNALGVAETLSLAIGCVEIYLPKFEQAHQEEKWAEKYMGLIKAAAASGELVELRANIIPLDHDNRRSKNLAFTIAELRYAVLNIHEPTKTIGSAAEVISRVFMFEIGDQMNIISPRVWGPSTTDPVEIQKFMNEGVMAGIRLRNHPAVAEIEIGLWLKLADEIQQRLEAG
ncbi:MAG: hypothetical protein H0X30_37865 [Anaerolineae bacterium]|nr:hypothetical protein [Anaerolineae bacterium]